jgi:hypothetical protein
MNRWSFLPGLIPIVILAIIFALPLKTVPVQTTETYWDVEMKDEPYTETESYTDTEPYTTTETYTKTVDYQYYDRYCSYWPGGISSTDYVKCQGYPSPYCIVCSASDPSTCRVWTPYCNNWGGPRVVTDTREVVKYRDVTKYREVVKHRQVPTKVLKERTVTTPVKISIWEYLFQ